MIIGQWFKLIIDKNEIMGYDKSMCNKTKIETNRNSNIKKPNDIIILSIICK